MTAERPVGMMPEPSYPGDPPAGAWITIDGHDWASNGRIAIRRDAPRPSELADPWWSSKRLAEVDVGQLFRFEGFDTAGCKGLKYRARYAAVLSAGVSEAAPGGLTRVLVDGEAVAYVMPLLYSWRFYECCDADGEVLDGE